MESTGRPGYDNARHLEQGIALIRGLDDAAYRGAPGAGGGVGAQLRHCLDFYSCFLGGIAAARIDYTARERDRRVESDREHAIRRLEAVVGALDGLPHEIADAEVVVRLERAEPTREGWCRSSGLRELQFLLSHTIHHYALIAGVLRLQGHSTAALPADFGVAPSTLRHWHEAGTPTG